MEHMNSYKKRGKSNSYKKRGKSLEKKIKT